MGCTGSLVGHDALGRGHDGSTQAAQDAGIPVVSFVNVSSGDVLYPSVEMAEEAGAIEMGRIVGDGALNFEIVDVAVDPAHQGKGLGRQIMQKIVSWLDENAVKGAYVSLVADVPELYAKFGFSSVRPESGPSKKV